MSKITLLFLAILFAASAHAQQCFLATSWNTGSSSYVGNAMTHSEKNGKNFFIFDGIAIHVPSPCVTSKLAFVVTQTDGYKNHYVCENGPATANNGASCIQCVGSSCQPVPSVCKGGATCSNPLPNTYDVGLYCVGGGSCQMGKLYAHVGPLDYATFFDCANHPVQCATFGQSKRYINTLSWQGGTVLLPDGDYAVGMATSCDDGRQTVAGRGLGDIKCGAGAGEGGPFGYTNNAQAVSAGTSLMAYKYFTGNGPTGCLTYDDVNGLIGDIGPGSPCNFSTIPSNGKGQAPHIINYVFY
jgi:hypothetical protein